MTIKEMQNIDIREAKLDDLVDIRTVEIDRNLSKEERIKQYVRQIKNPYFYKVGDVVVKLGFAENGPSITDLYKEMMSQAVI